MDKKTIHYYNKNAREFIERTVKSDMSICHEKFTELLNPGGFILDAGCGSGRDSKYFLECGFQVQAMDASAEMCNLAAEYIGHTVECMSFDEMQYRSQFDGVWACASLLHEKKAELPELLRRFHRALKPDGIMYASFKYGAAEEERLERFFSDYCLNEIEKVFLQDDLFELVESFETEDERPDYKNKPWVNIIVRKK